MGLRRAGITPADRLELKQLYRMLFLSGKNRRAAVAQGEVEFSSELAKTLLRFVSEAKRGVCKASVDSAIGEDE